jgi:hypothetical protein
MEDFHAFPLLAVEWLQPTLSLLLNGYPRRSHKCTAILTGSYLRDLIYGGAPALQSRIIEIAPTSFPIVMPARRVVQLGKRIVCIVRHCELPGPRRLTNRQVQFHFAVGAIDEVESLP